jgi:hypothetical protein
MNAGRLVWIFLIFCVISICWAILGGSVTQRTREADTNLREQVEGLWGQPIIQLAPTFTISHTEERREKGKRTTVWVPETILADSNAINVDMKLDLRRKGLLWYRCYTVSFDADYAISHGYDKTVKANASFTLPAANASYANFACTLNGKTLLPTAGQGQISGTVELKPNQKGTLHVHYDTRGLETWQYSFGQGVANIRNFKLTVKTDFDRVNFPPKTLSPSANEPGEGNGRKLVWDFGTLISGFAAGVEVPEKLNAGPVASRIAFFAPVGLLFFICVVVIIGLMQGRNLHPMHFFFIAAAFFAFHLLFSYLADHLPIGSTFLISAAMSVLLVVSYVIRVFGARYTFAVIAPAQLLFLVVFSYAFFWLGYTGLTITIASILVLAVLMHVTAGVKWDEKFVSAPRQVPPPRYPTPPPPPVAPPTGAAPPDTP